MTIDYIETMDKHPQDLRALMHSLIAVVSEFKMELAGDPKTWS